MAGCNKSKELSNSNVSMANGYKMLWLQLECQREWIQRHHRFGSCIWSYPQLCILDHFGGPMIFAAAESLQPRLDPWRASHIGTAWIYQRVEKLTCRGVLSFFCFTFKKYSENCLSYYVFHTFPFFSTIFVRQSLYQGRNLCDTIPMVR